MCSLPPVETVGPIFNFVGNLSETIARVERSMDKWNRSVEQCREAVDDGGTDFGIAVKRRSEFYKDAK